MIGPNKFTNLKLIYSAPISTDTERAASSLRQENRGGKCEHKKEIWHCWDL